ncbi:MAG TPA: sugar-binding domain-containing protein [Acidimicrobiales bacterium]|nr:sugar-binding domain-containing protein [Acidimicrobiales bacterium]
MPVQDDELRLMARVARLYYNEGVRQPDIARRLGLSQPRVSRLLKRALASGLVRITVLPVPGVNADLEDELQHRYGLSSAIVIDVTADSELLRCLGAAAAYHFETSLQPGTLVGVSSRSASLLAAVEALRPVQGRPGIRVVQMLGGIGDPGMTAQANRLTELFAARVGGAAYYLASPAVVASAAAARALRADAFVASTMQLYQHLDVAVVGIGALGPETLRARSNGGIERAELEDLVSRGAVGDVCLRFFDRAGRPVRAAFSDRVVGIDLDQLRKVPRCIAVAGGQAKADAIRGALLAGVLAELVIDRDTAELLLADRSPR